MPRRSPETLADYLVVAISPALIMLLVGSLMFFLIEVFYQGQYQGRLLFVMAMFVMAIVCVARISMEEGASYASLFGIPLAIVVGLALARFVEIRGPLAAVGPFINWGLMGLVWWAAHKLTWDCTLIDDSQDASGQGLLQEIGIEAAGQSNGAATHAPGTSAPATPDAVTADTSQQKSWIERWLEPDRRPHAPGVWVVYFSLFALPLFGFGGWFVPAGDAETKGRVFLFLSVYVATGLSLLVLTSFLGLRRYLRQRTLEMPLDMAATWVALGAALIVAMLGAAAILPRPTSEHSLSSLPVRFTSAIRSASQYAVGKEGTEDPKSDPNDAQTAAKEGQKTDRSGESGKPDGKETGSGSKGEKSGGSEKGEAKGRGSDAKGESSESGDSKSKGEQGDAGQGQKQGQKSDSGQDSKSGDRSGEQSSAKGEKSADTKSPQESPNEQQGDSAKGKSDSSSKQPQSESESKSSVFEEPQQNEPSEPSSQNAGSSPSPQPLSNITSWLSQSFGTLLKWIFYAVLLIGGLILAWTYRAELVAAWRKLLDELRQLWEGLFGRRAAAREATAEVAAAPPRPFSAFADPFLTGAAARMSWPQLVRYTFEAVEAWGRERACPRERDQTPHEFAQALGSAEPELARHVQSLAAWYSQLAYAAAAPPSGSAEPLRELWHNLHRTRPAQVE